MQAHSLHLWVYVLSQLRPSHSLSPSYSLVSSACGSLTRLMPLLRVTAPTPSFPLPRPPLSFFLSLRISAEFTSPDSAPSAPHYFQAPDKGPQISLTGARLLLATHRPSSLPAHPMTCQPALAPPPLLASLTRSQGLQSQSIGLQGEQSRCLQGRTCTRFSRSMNTGPGAVPSTSRLRSCLPRSQRQRHFPHGPRIESSTSRDREG